MTPKETAISTVEKFFELLGRKERVDDWWETYSFMSARVHDYQGRYMITADASKDLSDTITVRVYNFEDRTKRFYVLDVSKVTPELAAKFTKEAITAYEQELTE